MSRRLWRGSGHVFISSRASKGPARQVRITTGCGPAHRAGPAIAPDAGAAGRRGRADRARARLLHVGGLRQLHLDRVPALLGPAVVARGPAALESAIADGGIALCRAADASAVRATSGAQVAPSLVPMLKSGNPSNRTGCASVWNGSHKAPPPHADPAPAPFRPQRRVIGGVKQICPLRDHRPRSAAPPRSRGPRNPSAAPARWCSARDKALA